MAPAPHIPLSPPSPGKKVPLERKNRVYHIIYTYDLVDRVTSMTSPVGTTKYHYDDSTGRLDEIETPLGKKFRYSYDRGQVAALQYPNGITANYDFDPNGNLTDLNYQRGDGSTVQRFQYGYDKDGMRTSMTDNDGVHNYTYDSLYQIIVATHPTVQNPLERFSYDAVGNRLTDLTNTYQYNELNQLTEDDSCWYVYDRDGNQTEKISKTTGDTTHYVFDIGNQLVEVRKADMVARYAYDALGRRMKKDVNGSVTQYRYSGVNTVLEMDATDSISASYTYGPDVDDPLCVNDGQHSYYYLKDGIRSVTALTDSIDNIRKEYRYSVFGQVTEEVGDSSIRNSLTYTSRESDMEWGAHFYRMRYYTPGTGRFVSEDPMKLDAGDGNFYRYVSNNPINLVDPAGLMGKKAALKHLEQFSDEQLSAADKEIIAKFTDQTLGIGDLPTITAAGLGDPEAKKAIALKIMEAAEKSKDPKVREAFEKLKQLELEEAKKHPPCPPDSSKKK